MTTPEPITVTLPITRAVLRMAKPGSPTQCAISKATGLAVPGAKHVDTDADRIMFNKDGWKWRCSYKDYTPSVFRIISRNDAEKSIRPTEITLTFTPVRPLKPNTGHKVTRKQPKDRKPRATTCGQRYHTVRVHGYKRREPVGAEV